MSETIITVGHSNYEPEEFVSLLERVEVDVLIDVRSQPYSRFVSHFNSGALKAMLQTHGIWYSHAPALGGRPENPEMYDSAGHVLYGDVAQSQPFLQAIGRLEQEAETKKVAIMCGEEDPTECHRRLLVGRVLEQRGWEVTHLRGSGQLMTELQLVDMSGGPADGLFEGGEYSTWRSIRSVSPRDPRPNSSRR